MNDSKWIMILTIAILLLFNIVLLKPGSGGTLNVHESFEIEESKTEVKFTSNPIRFFYDGLVHVLGKKQSKENVIRHSNTRRINMCRVILDAMPIPASKRYDDGMEYVGNIPNVPELRKAFDKIAWPTMIAGSCNQMGSCMWSVLLKGKDCVEVEKLDYYVGSTMSEFTALSIGTQRRFLRMRGRCIGPEGEKPCTVPIGDPRAIEGAKVTVPYGWSRSNLDFMTGIGGSSDQLEIH